VYGAGGTGRDGGEEARKNWWRSDFPTRFSLERDERGTRTNESRHPRSASGPWRWWAAGSRRGSTGA
jgi:hypothetical protein